MRRFFFTQDQRQDDCVILDSDESHHISKVLRLKQGDLVELCDSFGHIFLAEIVRSGKKVELNIHEKQGDVNKKSGARLIVGQGAIKIKNMELVVQKCTELGVDVLYPYVGERSQGNVIQQYRGKGERWRRIISEACKQSPRPELMELLELVSFNHIISSMSGEEKVLRLLLWEKEKTNDLSAFRSQLRQSSTIQLLLGPEGGFTAKEVEEAKTRGWQTVGLGERILRAETAAVAAVSIVQHLRGCM